jgi:hypothetical protein
MYCCNPKWFIFLYCPVLKSFPLLILFSQYVFWFSFTLLTVVSSTMFYLCQHCLESSHGNLIGDIKIKHFLLWNFVSIALFLLKFKSTTTSQQSACFCTGRMQRNSAMIMVVESASHKEKKKVRHMSKSETEYSY